MCPISLARRRLRRRLEFAGPALRRRCARICVIAAGPPPPLMLQGAPILSGEPQCRPFGAAQSAHSSAINTNWLHQCEAPARAPEYWPRSSESRYFRRASGAPRSTRSSDCLRSASCRRFVVRSQPRECVTIVNALLDSDDIDAMGFCYLTLDVPARNVPTVSEKRTAEIPQYLIENAPRIGRSCHSISAVPLLDCFHE